MDKISVVHNDSLEGLTCDDMVHTDHRRNTLVFCKICSPCDQADDTASC